MLPVISLSTFILLFDLVFLGPLGLTLFEIRIRQLLIVLLVLLSIWPVLFRRSRDVWELSLFVAIVAFFVVWAFVVPLIRGTNLDEAIAESQPAVAILLLFPFYHLFLEYGPQIYLRFAMFCIATMAALVIGLWFLTNILGLDLIGLFVADLYLSISQSGGTVVGPGDVGIYIGPMPDGSFRVTLINFIVFPLMVAAYSWRKPSVPWIGFYVAASLATGTRAFFAIAASIGIAALFRQRLMLAIPIAITSAALIAYFVSSDGDLRILDFSSDFYSDSARYMQYVALIDLFWEYPLFGAGLGAHASVIRSYEAPYSYELTYVALLAKVGIVGSLIIILGAVAFLVKLIRHGVSSFGLFSLVIGFILITATNPYLLNVVGMSLLAFLIALGYWVLQRPSVHYDNLLIIKRSVQCKR